LCVTLVFYRKSRAKLSLEFALIALAIVGSIGVDVAKSLLLDVPTGLSRDGVVAGYSFSTDNFASRWQTLATTFQTILGEFLVISLLLVSANYAIRSVANLDLVLPGGITLDHSFLAH